MSLTPRQNGLLRKIRQEGTVREGPGVHQRTLGSLRKRGLVRERSRGKEKWWEVTAKGLGVEMPPPTATTRRVQGELMMVFASDVEAVLSRGPFEAEARRGLEQALRDHRLRNDG